MSNGFDWSAFLQQWSHAILITKKAGERLPQEVLAAQWLGYFAATEEQIALTEVRLGARLPPSYRAFLAVSNGWRLVDGVTDRLRSVEDINWFAERHQDWIDGWMKGKMMAVEQYGASVPISDDKYLVYDKRQRSHLFRDEYLLATLEISSNEPDEGAIYLLNPKIITPEGEWEAWFFADWLPGARRHQSFQEMMQATLINVLEYYSINDEE